MAEPIDPLQTAVHNMSAAVDDIVGCCWSPSKRTNLMSARRALVEEMERHAGAKSVGGAERT